jgi:hypothetical protein
MAKKTFPKPTGEKRPSFMFPWLHKDVVNAISHSIAFTWVRKSKSDRSAQKECTTHVMGRFRCMNNGCGTDGWGSKKVAILIRGYAENGYNAVVFNQRCRSCDQLGTLNLDEKSYVERVAYRIQKWAGVPVARPYYESKEGLPHKQDLCEGCKRGFCRKASNWEYN